MAPTEGWPASRLDQLAREFADQARYVNALATRVGNGEHDVETLEKAVEQLGVQFQRSLEAFDKSCDLKVSRIEQANERQEANLKLQIKELKDATEARRWPLMARIGLFAAVFSPLCAGVLQVALR